MQQSSFLNKNKKQSGFYPYSLLNRIDIALGCYIFPQDFFYPYAFSRILCFFYGCEIHLRWPLFYMQTTRQGRIVLYIYSWRGIARKSRVRKIPCWIFHEGIDERIKTKGSFCSCPILSFFSIHLNFRFFLYRCILLYMYMHKYDNNRLAKNPIHLILIHHSTAL